MRAVVITQTGGPEVLQVQQRPDPQPGRGEVLIDVRAAGVNFADLLARMGLYPDAPKLPAVVGYEVAGVVAALGEGVAGSIAVGQRVVAPTRFGGYAERVVAQADGVVDIPDALDFEAAAAIPIAYATAWEALVRPAICIRRAGPDPRRRRRRRHRRDAVRQAARRRDLGHRVAGQARRDPRLRRRSPPRLHPRGMGPVASVL